MTFLLTMIVVLLVVMVVYMTAIAILYVDLVKDEKKFRGVTNDIVKNIYEELDEMKDNTADLNFAMSQRVSKLEGDRKFATETINQARRLIKDAKEEIKAEGQTKTFKYVEPEEDPEEPRS